MGRESKRLGRMALVGATLLSPQPSSGACLSIIKGPVVVQALGCGAFDPAKFDLSKEKFQFIKDLDPQGRAKIYDSYRGTILRGTVVKSDAALIDGGGGKGALKGATRYFFVPPGEGNCGMLSGRAISAELEQVCCDGHGEAPCLLGTDLTLKKPLPLPGGADLRSATAGETKKAMVSKELANAQKLFKEKRYLSAIKEFETAKSKGEINPLGLYQLGFAYAAEDRCSGAVAPLKQLHQMAEKNELLADEENTAREGNFLLARCYAKLKRADEALDLLNAYILQPKKYQKELRESLQHPDFGFIRSSSKAFQDYEKEARKAQSVLKKP